MSIEYSPTYTDAWIICRHRSEHPVAVPLAWKGLSKVNIWQHA